MHEETVIGKHLSLLKSVAPSGFALGFHVIYTTPTFMFQTYARDWLDHYAQNGFLMLDPTVHWGFENTGYIAWSDLADADASGVLRKAADFGLNYGLTCAVESDGGRSFGSFSRSDRNFDATERDQLLATFTEIHVITAAGKALTEPTKAALKAMSVHYTQPGE